jgi:OOP family OmpA-OmpF porin
MSKTAGADDRAPAPQLDEASHAEDDATGDPEIVALRALLYGPEQAELTALRARIEDREARAEDVAAVLPQVLLQHADDPHLTRALSPPLERAITQSVQRNPAPLADALFPVMGPAIRKAVAAGLAGMVESLNRTLELAVSPRSIRWRLEAMRTGKSFAEVVLLKTLVYRVEQAFLIDRRSGLLLQHVQAANVAAQDADLVSGMLTAIRDFVHDSFKVKPGESLEALHVGDLAVWIEPGPHAIVAAVIRGTAPRELRPVMQDALETIHLQFGDVLESFSGDTTELEGSRPALESCLQTQYRAGERKPSPRGMRIVAALAAVALLVWIGFAYRASLRRDAYVDALRREPGLVVLSTSRSGGKLVVEGLRDPQARDPIALVAGTGLTAEGVEGRWAPYLSLDPAMVIARARARLLPPDGVTLSLAGDVLLIDGAAPAAWIAQARERAPSVAGVRVADVEASVDAAAASAIAAVNGMTLLFERGSTRPAAGQDELLGRLVIHIRELDALAAAAGLRYRVEITGHTDADGPDESNLPLSRARAEQVRAALRPESLPALEILTTGQGSRQPAAASADEAGKQRNRRVTLHVARRVE